MKKIFFLIFFLFLSLYSTAQENSYILGFRDTTQKSVSLKFKLVNNLIIIPLSINNSDTLYFILDSGINPTILTNNKTNIPFKIGRKSNISGLGKSDDLSVLQTYGNTITIADNVLLTLQNVFIVQKDRFQLSEKMGTKIDGIIGSAIFNNFIVKINYDTKKVTFYNSKTFKQKRFKRWIHIPINIYNQKPYVKLKIKAKNDTIRSANFLLDLGASDALWLIQSSTSKIKINHSSNSFYLGQGINGSIYGGFDKIDYLYFTKKIYFKNVQVNIPDTTSLRLPKNYNKNNRIGTLGSEIIKRFNIIIDYKNKELLLRKNSLFSAKFRFDLSGLELDKPYVNLPVYEVFYVQKKSPSAEAGLLKGDVFIKVNNISVSEYSLNDLILMFRSREGRKLKIKYMRGGEIFKTKIILRNYRFDR